jgi:hypothetical protein
VDIVDSGKTCRWKGCNDDDIEGVLPVRARNLETDYWPFEKRAIVTAISTWIRLLLHPLSAPYRTYKESGIMGLGLFFSSSLLARKSTHVAMQQNAIPRRMPHRTMITPPQLEDT